MSTFRQDKIKTLEARRNSLTDDYRAVNRQRDNTLNEGERTRLQRQSADLEQEINDVERELKLLRSGNITTLLIFSRPKRAKIFLLLLPIILLLVVWTFWPKIYHFKANPLKINSGDKINLTWNTSYFVNLRLKAFAINNDQKILDVPLPDKQGVKTCHLEEETQFELQAENWVTRLLATSVPSTNITEIQTVAVAPILTPTNTTSSKSCNQEQKYEPNDRRTEACEIRPNEIITAYPDDREDIYYFDLDNPASVVVIMANYTTVYDFEEELGQLLVYNDDFEDSSIAAIRHLQNSVAIPRENNDKALKDLRPGRYYIRIYTYLCTFQSERPYSLQILVTPVTS